MATWIPTGYGPRTSKIFFTSNESKYELWEVKFQGYPRLQHLHQIILSTIDQNDGMDFVEKNATVFEELIQYLDDKFVISNKRCKRQWKKGLKNIKGTLFIKRKAENYFHLWEDCNWSITDYIFKAENISNSLKEAGEIISNGLLIAIVLKWLPPNFKPFTVVITQKKKTLTFMFKKLWRNRVYVSPPPHESNNMLQMKTPF